MFWKCVPRAAALGAVVLLGACHSNALPPQPGTGSQSIFTPGQRFPQCAGVIAAPVVEGTPLPLSTGRASNAGTFSPRAGTAYVYVADENNYQIDIFPLEGRRQPQVGTITAGIYSPYGIWFDSRAQSLYVANQTNNTVTVYPYGSTQPTLTYSQDLDRPLYPLVDRHGELYVSNANNGSVVEYLAGTTKVHQVLQTPGIEADGLALDRHENLYVAYRTCPSGAGSIEKFAPGSAQGHVIGMTLSDPQGVVVDSSGNVVVDETGTANSRLHRIDVFPPGSKIASREVQLPQGNLPIELVIDRDENSLYVSGLYNIVFGATYPLTGQPLFVKEQVSAIIQGVTTTKNLEFRRRPSPLCVLPLLRAVALLVFFARAARARIVPADSLGF
jgi:DNA-binding beta-propeller fold protein YncE